MDDLRSWWEVPSIAHFCSLFRSAFDLTDFDIEDLEEGFLQSETEEGSAFLLDLLCRLLNGCYGRKDITIANYDLYVKDIIKYKWDTSQDPIKEKTEFKALSMREKVEFIHAICEYRLDTEDVIELLKGFEGDSMRVEPLGKNKNGALYWYFYGNRLYMEDPLPKKELTKEEKRAKDREKRIESKRKKQEEKRQRKEERIKLKALRKAEREKKAEEAKKAEDSKTRRSGRLRTRKLAVPESESSESSSSSEEDEEEEEEEEIDDSSQEDTEVEEVVEKKTGRGKSRKTPAKTPAKRGATNQKTPKKETPVKGTRSSGRKSATKQKAPEPPIDTGVRRSARKRKQPEPLPSPYNSDTEEDHDYDVDSGHESAGSLRSETSKVSAKSSTSKKSAGPAKRTSRRPTATLNLKRDLSRNDDDEDGEVEKENDDVAENETEKGKDSIEMEVDECKENGGKREAKGEANEKKREVEGKEGEENVCEEDKGKEDAKEIDDEVCDDVEGVKDEKNTCEDVGSGEGNEEENKLKVEDDTDSKPVIGEGIKSEAVEMKENDIDVKDNKIDESKEDVKDKQVEISKGDPDNIADGKIKTEADPVEDESTVKTEDIEKVEADAKEKMETEEGLSDKATVKTDDIEKVEADTEEKMEIEEGLSDKKLDEQDEDSCNVKKEVEAKPDIEMEENSNDSNVSGVKRSLRKRNTEDVMTEEKDDEEANVKDEVKPDVFTLSKPAVEPTPSKSSTRWHLVCQTLEDWMNLAQWFKESPVRCEKSLSKVIREDFLPVLPEIIEAREKERQKKLLQEQELRRSNRITVKMREKIEQEKILAEALAEEEKARIKAEEERKLKEEQLRLEDENRQREDRRKAREERAKRLSMRGERARLLAEGKEIPADMIYTGSQKYKDDGDDSDDSRCDLKEEEDYEALMKVINAMKYHKDCWPFLQPVTDEQAPGYSEIIKRPMDLSKIEEKVEKRDYRSTQHFLSDFRLMFNNCKRFNGQDSEFSDCARSMENMLKKYMKRFVSEEPTDKYYEDKPFMVPGGRGGPRTGEKRYRPQRAASSRALQTVHKALNDDDTESSSDEEDHIPQRKKSKDSTASPFRTQSHDKLLLDKMIELKRQRERKLAASALHNHGIITRGPERIRVQNPQGGVMIIPKSEMNPSGVLRMAATREIKRKVNTQLPNLTPVSHRYGNFKPAGTPNNPSQTVLHADLSKKETGLSIIDQTTPGSNQPKVIKIVAANAQGQQSVKQTAENVRVSSDGYLIISGKNSGIKVTENTKIVIQPPPSASGPVSSSSGGGQSQTIRQIPATSNLQQTTSQSPSGTAAIQDNAITGSSTASAQNEDQVPVQGNSSPSGTQLKMQQPLDLQGILKQTAINPKHPALQGLVNQMANKTNLTPEMKKKLDIAQRILLQHEQKKKLLEQQKSAQMPKLEVNLGASGSSAIEERLKDPIVNIDKQLGSVSQNVISNVNIASDILDTYYSVLNEAKSKAGSQNVPSASGSLPENTRQLNLNQTVTQSGANVVSSIPTSSVQGGSGQGTLIVQSIPNVQTTVSNLNTVNDDLQNSQNQKASPAHGMSEVTRQIYNLISKTSTGGLVTALANAQKMKTNICAQQSWSALSISPQIQVPAVSIQSTIVNQAPQALNQVPQTINPNQIIVNQVQQMIKSQAPQVTNQTQQIINQAQLVVNTVPQSVNQSPQTSNRIPHVINQTQQIVDQVPRSGNHIPQTVSNLTSSSSVSDLLRTAMFKQVSQSSSDVCPIEALLAKSTPLKTVPGDISKTIPNPSLVQALQGQLPVSLNVKKSEISPEKSERKNLFDSFEANKVNASAVIPNPLENDQSLSSQAEKQDLTGDNVPLEVKLKLRADGISLPASSTLNFGSPLKATSVLEALKCKLHTVKPQTEVSGLKSSEVPISGDSNPDNRDEYLAPASTVSTTQGEPSLYPETTSENAMNSSLISGLSPNDHPQALNIALSSSNVSNTNVVPTGYQQMVSVDGGNILTSVSVIPSSGNFTQNVVNTTPVVISTPMIISQGNVIFSTNMMQESVQSNLIPTTVQVSQGNPVQPVQLQTMLEQGTGNLPNVPTLQGTLTQPPVQVPSALLQALKQGSTGLTINPSTQNSLLQQLNSLISNRPQCILTGSQNAVVMNLKPVNPSNNLPQGIQSVNLMQASSTLQSQNVDASGGYSTGNVEITTTRLVSEDNGLCNDFSGLDSTTNLSDYLSSVNQSNLQASSYVTGTDVEMMDTSQNASLSLTETEENQL